MTTDAADSDEEFCIFCLIANGRDKETKIIKKNKDLVCFRDIYPAAPHHFLVVPREHIHSCHSLHRGHINVVKQMAQLGKAVLHEQGITNMKDVRLGFHQPPYISVGHLHLHVLAPASEISFDLVYKFTPKAYNFLTEEHLLKRLHDIDPPYQHKLEKYLCLPLQKRNKDGAGVSKTY
ncbi:histidine triad nucleotide-binding protein 3-like [Parambassis ranga]|uniref:Histidine triad nucleotide-binding protein 3-like n=1 Tax=Parambassis ranga TaxID=210632 RepID=A0A6P7HCJ0_9TELE|nr:histidine triad nucleotide-binding protein 3-like [Parambassis ranga]